MNKINKSTWHTVNNSNWILQFNKENSTIYNRLNGILSNNIESSLQCFNVKKSDPIIAGSLVMTCKGIGKIKKIDYLEDEENKLLDNKKTNIKADISVVYPQNNNSIQKYDKTDDISSTFQLLVRVLVDECKQSTWTRLSCNVNESFSFIIESLRKLKILKDDYIHTIVFNGKKVNINTMFENVNNLYSYSKVLILSKKLSHNHLKLYNTVYTCFYIKKIDSYSFKVNKNIKLKGVSLFNLSDKESNVQAVLSVVDGEPETGEKKFSMTIDLKYSSTNTNNTTKYEFNNFVDIEADRNYCFVLQINCNDELYFYYGNSTTYIYNLENNLAFYKLDCYDYSSKYSSIFAEIYFLS